MDKRPPSEDEEGKGSQAAEEEEVEDDQPEFETSAVENPVTEIEKDDQSELPECKVYVLLLGTDSLCFTKYVEKVMAAKSRLTKMGWKVAGAFISAKALESQGPGKRAVPNPEYDKFIEAHKEVDL
jgi:hypothetical protein